MLCRTRGRNLTPQETVDEWRAYVRERMDAELEQIVREEDLRPEGTRALVRRAFEEGAVPEDGTAVSDLLRPMSRFARRRGGDSRAEAKARALDRLKAYYERYHDIAPAPEG